MKQSEGEGIFCVCDVNKRVNKQTNKHTHIPITKYRQIPKKHTKLILIIHRVQTINEEGIKHIPKYTEKVFH